MIRLYLIFYWPWRITNKPMNKISRKMPKKINNKTPRKLQKTTNFWTSLQVKNDMLMLDQAQMMTKRGMIVTCESRLWVLVKVGFTKIKMMNFFKIKSNWSKLLVNLWPKKLVLGIFCYFRLFSNAYGHRWPLASATRTFYLNMISVKTSTSSIKSLATYFFEQTCLLNKPKNWNY